MNIKQELMKVAKTLQANEELSKNEIEELFEKFVNGLYETIEVTFSADIDFDECDEEGYISENDDGYPIVEEANFFLENIKCNTSNYIEDEEIDVDDFIEFLEKEIKKKFTEEEIKEIKNIVQKINSVKIDATFVAKEADIKSTFPFKGTNKITFKSPWKDNFKNVPCKVINMGYWFCIDFDKDMLVKTYGVKNIKDQLKEEIINNCKGSENIERPVERDYDQEDY